MRRRALRALAGLVILLVGTGAAGAAMPAPVYGAWLVLCNLVGLAYGALVMAWVLGAGE